MTTPRSAGATFLHRCIMKNKVIEFLALAATGAAFGALLAWGAFL